MSEGLKPVPEGLDVEIRHEGVTCRGRGWSLDITHRHVSGWTRGWGSESRDVKFRLQDIDRYLVAAPPDNFTGHYLVVGAGEQEISLARGQSLEALRWMRDAITYALARRAAREAAEGREYGFEQVAPAPITALVDRGE